MADLAIISTVASLVSATQASFELGAKVPHHTFTQCSVARGHVNHARALREDTLNIVEKHKDDLPHEFIHKWRLNHNRHVAMWSNLMADMDKFDSLSIVQRTFSIRLRRKITDIALEHSMSCQDSWMSVQVATNELRAQLVSRHAHEQETFRNIREYGTLSMDIPKLPPHVTPTSTSNASTPTPAGSVRQVSGRHPLKPDRSETDPFDSPEDYAMDEIQLESSALPSTSPHESRADS